MNKVVAGILLGALLGMTFQAAWASDGYSFLELNGHYVKWGTPAFGRRATLTYAIAGASTKASGIRNCRKITAIGGLLSRSDLTRAVFDTQLKAAFAMWENAADIRFVPAKRAASADILISAEAVPNGVAYTDVTPLPAAAGVIDRLKKAIVCLNPQLHWIATVPKSPPDEADLNTYKLKYVLAHEIGHALGLNHPGPTGELMSFEYNRNIDGLQPGDVAGIIALYGPQKNHSAIPVVALNVKAAP
ncbi:MAG: matrixin family metalloprotease [Alphaproteobacteria bacterium]|nr:matrixin family metalloprotease [Alphaproteobacteria bacterium]MDE2110557.1 matrixin family metalloprotease [Alphaproteobacteria bacterium]MDE2492715.1 matrixin family metalloprotease [Alphaproteobacteria bacterium]